MNKKTITMAVIAAACVTLVVAIIAATSAFAGMKPQKTLEQLMSKIDYNTATPTKASISLDNVSLYDELPDIEKYPLAVSGRGQIDIEIFTSGEKAGLKNDAWLIDCANAFNGSNYKTASGTTISMSVRSVSSGLAADYIISGKYLPDLYTPSNQLFGEYAIANGGNLELYNNKLVGNTAGILIRNNLPYENINAIVNDVIDGKLNIGYTNPQTSATGLNLLLEILNSKGGIYDPNAIAAFADFNNNIPFVAYTTQQMVESAANGTLDGMVSEYQAYINDDNLKNAYKFIPFGTRHDNPLYIVNKYSKAPDELEAIEIINDYLISEASQKIATRYGFNAKSSHTDSYVANGSDVTQALKTYKTEKDAGKDIIAVFVADCSGSMSGDPMLELKSSLSNGMHYINENNYIGLVSYSSDVTIEVPIAKFDLTQKSYFQGAINKLDANGNTASYEAICVGLDMIEKARVDNPDAKCMLFLLSDGYANGRYAMRDIEFAVTESQIPIYTIGYTNSADMDSLRSLSNINEAASISADSDDVIYKIKSLFNAQL